MRAQAKDIGNKLHVIFPMIDFRFKKRICCTVEKYFVFCFETVVVILTLTVLLTIIFLLFFSRTRWYLAL